MLRKVVIYLAIASVSAFLAFAFTAAVLTSSDGAIEVIIQNNGPEALEDVKVRTNQDSYTLGDIPVGKSESESFNPAGESSLEVLHASRPEWQAIDIYMTGGISGRVIFNMKEGEVAGFTSTLSP